MIIANVTVDRTKARASGCQGIPRGLVGGEVTLDFRDSAWEGLTKTAVFRGAVTRDVPVTGNTVTIPWETVSKAGRTLYMGVYGVAEGGKLAVPTIWAKLGPIEGAADPSGDLSAPATPEFWVQMSSLIGDMSQLETQTRESLVAAVNELIHTTMPSDGKTAYEYALEAGYTGSEAQFAAKLADNTVYLPAPASAKAGQYIQVTAVDSAGKVTATAAVTLGDSEGVEF